MGIYKQYLTVSSLKNIKLNHMIDNVHRSLKMNNFNYLIKKNVFLWFILGESLFYYLIKKNVLFWFILGVYSGFILGEGHMVLKSKTETKGKFYLFI